VSQEDRADGAYVLREGRALSTIKSEVGGASAVVAVLHAGSVFSILSLVDGHPHSANVIAVEPTKCLFIPAKVFKELLPHPEFHGPILNWMAGMVRNGNQWIRHLL